MHNNITRGYLDVLIDFFQQDSPIIIQSSNVRAFEKEWSQ